MAFNGNGVFNRLYSWTNDAAANIKIRADRMDAETDGIATGLSTCITKDGQTTVTANLPMATYKHTGVGNASARTDYAAAGQVADGSINWVDASGTADAITANYALAYDALVDGMVCYVRASAANATTTPTFSPSGLTAHTIVKNGGNALVAGDVAGDGHELFLRYELANTRWELLNPATVSASNIHSGSATDGYALLADGSGGSAFEAIPDPLTTGDVKLTIKTSADSGWVIMDDGTIGSASSGATTRANADTEDLYALLWDNISDTYAPVTGGRGASAAADFAADKPIALMKVLGRALGVSGAGASLTSRALGETVGAETHALTEAELAAHTHSYNEVSGTASKGSSGSAVYQTTTSGTTGSAGNGNAHNNMQPTSFLNVMIKL